MRNNDQVVLYELSATTKFGQSIKHCKGSPVRISKKYIVLKAF